MWVERVSARAFGPFRDAVLELAPGLTVAVGPNEAGKSSWHAALRLALTGRRRGRGGRTSEDRDLEERHRPWDDADGPWEVEARLHLTDGRVIEINQDLAGRVDCRAVDVGLGRDVSAEIIVDGSPDASRWLGLDRHAFAATVSVDQGRILAVIDAADGLQDDMQRAAASAGHDATAAEAIARLGEFRKSAVGADTRVAVGPLRQARQAAVDAAQGLSTAREAHQRHLAHAAQAWEAAGRLAIVRERLWQAEAAVEQSRASALTARAQRAAALASRHPAHPPALSAAEHDTARVATAIHAWRGRPTAAVLEGPDSRDIERRLAALPAAPVGDVAPHASVLYALSLLDQAEGAAAEIDRGSASVAQAPANLPLLAGAGLAAAVGVIALVVGAPLVGLALIGLGLGLAGWVVLARRSRRAAPIADLESRQAEVRSRMDHAAESIRTALRIRDAPADGDPRAAVAAYTAACAGRARAAAAAAQAEPLRRELDARRRLEGTAVEAAAAIARAEAELRVAAERIGQPANGTDPEGLVRELEDWQRRRTAELRAGEEAIAEWQELIDVLDGRTLAELEMEAAEAARRVADAGFPALAAAGPDLAAALARAEAGVTARQSELLAAERSAATLEGEVRQPADRSASVAEAEEALGAAQAELQRVLALADTLDQALVLLRRAEEQVHRDLAPILAEAVRRFLPRISGGGYADVAVDPRDLRVRVKEEGSGKWRDAWRLSEGTREQIYLLLRVAMAQHLVTTGETAPLILDEVTAQADDERRDALLGILQELSRERQVVLFTHDTRIATWAENHLDPGHDALVTLGGRIGAGV